MRPEDDRSDRPSRQLITVECLSCGRARTLGPEHGIGGESLSHVTRRLKCSACGSRAVKAARAETPRDVARLLRARMGGS